ncbi:hypothetical protein FSP39_015732 [Pinctada imbricata]|uniref:Uncharacterized protein n=1 Tax=Pinctada imbricata TaxID=66713 RepID=A0AA88XWY2_PINIB|nr:hypothetical protein FSP39_015732 [Pinctada imbricata]
MPKVKTKNISNEEEDFRLFTKETLMKITQKLDDISEELHGIKCIIQVSDQNQENLAKISSDTEFIREVVQNLEPTSTQNSEETHVKDISNNEAVNEPLFNESAAMRARQQYIQQWNLHSKNRRIAFWNMVKNAEKANVYQSWLQSDNPTIPRKFQMPEIAGELENQRMRREKLAREKFLAEIDLLAMRGKYNEEKYKAIDDEVSSFFVDKVDHNTHEDIMKLWRDECLQEEEKSLERWLKTEKWMKGYEVLFKKQNRERNPYIKVYKGNDQRNLGFNGGNKGRHFSGSSSRDQETQWVRNEYPNRKNRNVQREHVKPNTNSNYNSRMSNNHMSESRSRRPWIPYHERPYRVHRNGLDNRVTSKSQNSFLEYGRQKDGVP